MTSAGEVIARARYEREQRIRGPKYPTFSGVERITSKKNTWDDLIEDAKASYLSNAEAILLALREDGWAVVPREPTDDMYEIGHLELFEALPDLQGRLTEIQGVLGKVYRAMIAAGEKDDAASD